MTEISQLFEDFYADAKAAWLADTDGFPEGKATEVQAEIRRLQSENAALRQRGVSVSDQPCQDCNRPLLKYSTGDLICPECNKHGRMNDLQENAALRAQLARVKEAGTGLTTVLRAASKPGCFFSGLASYRDIYEDDSQCVGNRIVNLESVLADLPDAVRVGCRAEETQNGCINMEYKPSAYMSMFTAELRLFIMPGTETYHKIGGPDADGKFFDVYIVERKDA